MKRIILPILCSVFSMLLLSCDSKAPDTYVEGKDYQYMYANRNRFFPDQAGGADGMFFLIGSYIYHLDEQTMKLLPLCNKPECLHDHEADSSRVKYCNAFTNAMGNAGIAYMDGYIYCIAEENGQQGRLHDVLYRIKEDGSEKERIYEWEGSIVGEWCIHRNVLYYMEHTYDEEGREYFRMKKMALNGIHKNTPETIYAADSDIIVYSMGSVKAYGNHVEKGCEGHKGKSGFY